MRRARRNPFSILLGVVGVLFVLTAANDAVAVLRGVKQAEAGAEVQPHALHTLMDRHGTTILVVELVVLAAATVGAVAFDHAEGEWIRRARAADRERQGE